MFADRHTTREPSENKEKYKFVDGFQGNWPYFASFTFNCQGSPFKANFFFIIRVTVITHISVSHRIFSFVNAILKIPLRSAQDLLHFIPK